MVTNLQRAPLKGIVTQTALRAFVYFGTASQGRISYQKNVTVNDLMDVRSVYLNFRCPRRRV